eukprot:g1948.t1
MSEMMPGLKKILQWSMKQTSDQQDDNSPTENVAPLSKDDQAWLSEAMEAFCLNETQRLKDLVQILECKPSLNDVNNAADVAESVASHDPNREVKTETLTELLADLNYAELLKLQLASLVELGERLEQIDNARFFALNHGGSGGKLPLLVSLIKDRQEDEIRWRAADVLAAVVQNNPQVQARAVELGVLDFCMNMVSDASVSDQLRLKSFLCVSCLIRSTTDVFVKAFLHRGGLTLLRKSITNTNNETSEAKKLLKKSLFLLQYITLTVPECRSDVANDQVLFVELVKITGGNNVSLSDMALHTLGSLCKDPAGAKALHAEDISHAKATLTQVRKQLENVPKEEAEYVEDTLKLVKKLLVVAAIGVAEGAKRKGKGAGEGIRKGTGGGLSIIPKP